MRRFPSLVVLAASSLFAVSCTNETTGSNAATDSARIGLLPSFSPAASLAFSALATSGIDITNVHVRLTAPDGSVRDSTIAFPVGTDTLLIEMSVPTRTAGQSFRADLELRNAAGQVLFSGSEQIVAQSSSLLGTRAASVVLLQYTGPGSSVRSVTLAPANQTLVGPATLSLSAAGMDAAGSPVQDILVSFGTSDASLATVVRTGNATATLTSAGKRGIVTISASTPLNVTGTARVSLVPLANRLVVISGGGQMGAAGSMLPQPLIVEARAADDLPVGGVPVTFRAITPGGSVTTTTTVADSTGRASTTLTLGPTAGAYQFEAAAATLTPVTATDTATPAPAATIAIGSGNGQSAQVATALAQPLTVKVLDRFGVLVTGAAVQWTRVSGSGAVAAATTTTGPNGIASNGYTLGNRAGIESIRASLSGATGDNVAVVFSENGTAGPAAMLSSTGSNQRASAGATLPYPLTVRVADAYSNPVPNVPVVWRVTGNANGTASFAPSVSTSDADGFAPTVVTLGNTPGPLTIAAIVSSALSTTLYATADAAATGTSGSVSGLVYDAVGNGPLAGATITLTPSGQTSGSVTVQSGNDGRYSTGQLATGLYDVQVSRQGYVTTTIVALRVSGNTVAEAVPLVPASEAPGSISGTISDATTGQPLSTPVTVELRAGLNALTGSPIQTVQTNEAAQYVFTNISAGTYTVLARASGYTDASKTGISVGAATTGNQNVFISPVSVAGTVRIVLTWRTTPRDLDSHLTGPTGTDTTNRFHVYYGDRGSCTSSPFACLDKDVTTGSGPETMTISQVFPGRYRYGVQNYTCCGNSGDANDATLSQSGAVVSVYVSSVLVRTFAVPAGAGSFWTVFELNGTTITPIDQIVSLGAFGGAVTRVPNASGAAPLAGDDSNRILDDIRAHPKLPRIRR